MNNFGECRSCKYLFFENKLQNVLFLCITTKGMCVIGNQDRCQCLMGGLTVLLSVICGGGLFGVDFSIEEYLFQFEKKLSSIF